MHKARAEPVMEVPGDAGRNGIWLYGVGRYLNSGQ